MDPAAAAHEDLLRWVASTKEMQGKRRSVSRGSMGRTRLETIPEDEILRPEATYVTTGECRPCGDYHHPTWSASAQMMMPPPPVPVERPAYPCTAAQGPAYWQPSEEVLRWNLDSDEGVTLWNQDSQEGGLLWIQGSQQEEMPPPVYATMPKADDIMLEMFFHVRNNCMNCPSPATVADDMVCWSGGFTCINCFLNGRECTTDDKLKESEIGTLLQNTEVYCGKASDYVTEKVTRKMVNLDGEKYQLEIQFKVPNLVGWGAGFSKLN